MAMEPGGRADKLGNEYERLWVVRQVLQVLTGEAVAVTWEPAGHDSVGVDVLVELPNGVAESINGRIQAVKRMTCGFRNTERFQRAIYFHLGDLDLHPASVTHTKV